MSIYAIGDLHLSLNQDKPMDIFGNNWKNHETTIRENWIKTVNNDDLVLLPGDLSWAMNIKEMYDDFNYLDTLPGKKLLLKGNHDYWWTTLSSMKNFLQDNKFTNIDFIYNNSYEYNNTIIVGTRGWTLNETENSEKMNHREEERLKLSIQDGINKYGNKEIICMMHYPPLNKDLSRISGYIDIMKTYGIKTCIYGHLHSKSHKDAYEGQYEGINFKLVSSDYINFELYKVK